MVQMVKNPHVMRETHVWSLGWEDPLEKGMATHSSIKEFHGQRSLIYIYKVYIYIIYLYIYKYKYKYIYKLNK